MILFLVSSIISIDTIVANIGGDGYEKSNAIVK